MKTPAGYIVVYDDDQGICLPMGRDKACAGALEPNHGPVLVFAERKQARRAVRISAHYAKLCRAQGKVANDDFIGDGLKHVKVLPLVSAE